MSAYGAVEGKLGDTVAYYSSPRFLMGFGALVAAYRAFFTVRSDPHRGLGNLGPHIAG